MINQAQGHFGRENLKQELKELEIGVAGRTFYFFLSMIFIIIKTFMSRVVECVKGGGVY